MSSHSSAVEMFRRMTFGQSPVIFFLTLVSSGLVAVAAYFWSVVDKFRIPITPGLPEVATVLPVVNFIALKYLTNISRGRRSPAWSLQAGIISILLVMIDTVVVTQAINNIPNSSISCPVEKTWRNWYKAHDEKSIRTVQDAFNCCGLNSYKDQAWPFQGHGVNATACSEIYKRNHSCFDPWSQKLQLSAGMFLAVAVVSFLSKAIIFAVYRRRATKQAHVTPRLISAPPENGSENNGVGAIAGLRLRPDERTRFPEAREDDDAESVVNEGSRLLKDSDRTPSYDSSRLLEGGEVPVLPAVDSGVWRNEHSRTHPSG